MDTYIYTRITTCRLLHLRISNKQLNELNVAELGYNLQCSTRQQTKQKIPPSCSNTMSTSCINVRTIQCLHMNCIAMDTGSVSVLSIIPWTTASIQCGPTRFQNAMYCVY